MNVILDTNILIQDFLMKSAGFSLLFDYLKKTGSRVFMPLIVYQELVAIYRSKLDERLKTYQQATKTLELTIVDGQLVSPTIDIPGEVEKYLEFVRKKLGVHDNNLIPFRENYLNELVTRALARKRPFSEKGEEFRDALLWLTVLDIAQESKSEQETLAFISNDTKAFGSNDQLHESLLHEAEDTGTQINFYNSIMKFIESHATKVEFITPGWLFNAINFEAYSDLVTERLKDYLNNLKERDLRHRGWEGLEFTGYISATGPITEENLTEHYVYEKSDGSLYVQANFYVEFEVEFTFREKVRQESDLWYSREDYDYDDEFRFETKTVYKYPEAEIIFGVVVKEKQVVDIELSDWYL